MVRITIDVDERDAEEMDAEAAARQWSRSQMWRRVIAGYLRSTEQRRKRVVELGILAEAETGARG